MYKTNVLTQMPSHRVIDKHKNEVTFTYIVIWLKNKIFTYLFSYNVYVIPTKEI